MYSYEYGAYVLPKALDTKLLYPASDAFQLYSVLTLIKTMCTE